MIETIEDEYGGERQAGKALGLATEIKRLKRFANDRQHDHRHAPASPGNAAAITDAERGQTLEDARVILEAYAAAACR